MSTHNLRSEHKCKKFQNFLSENFQFLVVKFSEYLNRHVFVMLSQRNKKHIYLDISVYLELWKFYELYQAKLDLTKHTTKWLVKTKKSI